VNAERLLGGDSTKLLDFFALAHARRHHVARGLLGEVPVGESAEFTEMMGRCYQPNRLDICERGLVEIPDPLPTLNRAKLIRGIIKRGQDIFIPSEEETDPNEPGTRLFRVYIDPWYLSLHIDFADLLTQVSVECDARIGMGPLSLDRQLSLHSVFGIGGLGVNLAEPGQEEGVADVLLNETRLLVKMLRDALTGLDPGVPIEEVKRIEAGWIEWLSEVRRARASRRKQRSDENR